MSSTPAPAQVPVADDDISGMTDEEKQARANQIGQAYKLMRGKIQQLAQKISELDQERNEHT
jgi:hypothetical protein